MKPLIGLTGLLQSDGRLAVHSDYARTITLAGGIPVLFAAGQEIEAAQWISRIDACLLTGGADIAAHYYGEAQHALTEPDPFRDAYELSLCQALYQADVPTLGICRGAQVMSVALGGSLHQHKEGHSGGVRHTIRVENPPPCFPKTPDVLQINSYHHQCVDRLPQDALAIAYAQDGVCEGLYFPNKTFFVGVQWHPERDWEHPLSQALFFALIQSASKKR